VVSSKSEANSLNPCNKSKDVDENKDIQIYGYLYHRDNQFPGLIYGYLFCQLWIFFLRLKLHAINQIHKLFTNLSD